MKKTFRKNHLLHILNSFDQKRSALDAHLGAYFRANRALGSKDRSWIAETIYGMVRWQGLIDHFCSDSHEWENRLAVFETGNIQCHLSDLSIPAHVRASIPKELFDILTTHFGKEEAISLSLICNTQAPTTIRINPIKTTRETLFDLFSLQFPVTKTSISPWGISFKNRLNFQEIPQFKEGHFEVQDEGSQLVANLVEPEPGNRILDYCAGSGGKTLAFAHKLRGKGQVYLHDKRPQALLNAKKRLKRAGIENGQILPWDAPYKQSLEGSFDWVLVDVPCSGVGTLRRNPDLKWKFNRSLLDRLIQEQRNIVAEALPFLSPSGSLVYATCSLLPEENERQIEYFQETYGLIPHLSPFRSLPVEGGMDGFFGAVLHR